MDIKDLQSVAVIILVVAAITLIAIALATEYSYQLRDEDVAASVDNLLLVAYPAATSIGTTGQYPFLQTVTNCKNHTNGSILLPAANYTVSEGNEDGGTILLTNGTRLAGDRVNCSITYMGDTAAQDSADKFIIGMGIFGTFMAVIVLAVIGTVIIRLFRGGRKEY